MMAAVAAAMPKLDIRLSYNEDWLSSDPVRAALDGGEDDGSNDDEEER